MTSQKLYLSWNKSINTGNLKKGYAKCLTDWLIDLDSMSTCLGLFYAKGFGNHVHV